MLIDGTTEPNSPDSSYQFPFEFATALRPDKELKHLSWLLEASLAYSAVCRDPLGTAISKASVEKFNAALTGAQPEVCTPASIYLLYHLSINKIYVEYAQCVLDGGSGSNRSSILNYSIHRN
jgi:hypothetical protein